MILRSCSFHIHFDPKTFVFIPKDQNTDPERYFPSGEYSVLKASLSDRKKDYEGFVSDLKYVLFDPVRVPMPVIDRDKRKLSFIEHFIGYSREEAIKEASRCLECKLCEEACPAHLKISDYIHAMGAEFRFGARVGKDVMFEEIIDFDRLKRESYCTRGGEGNEFF